MSTNNPASPSGLVLGNKTYDRAKFLVTIFLPALGALYAGLAALWGFGAVEQVLGTLTVLATFLGIVLRISSNNFQGTPEAAVTPDGAFVVTDLPNGKKNVELQFEQDPASLIDGRQLTFQVKTDNPVDQNLDDQVPRDENLS